MTEPKTSKSAFDAASGDPDRTRFPALAGLVAESSKKGHVLLGEPHEDRMVAQTYAFLAANARAAGMNVIAADVSESRFLEKRSDVLEKLKQGTLSQQERDQITSSMRE